MIYCSRHRFAPEPEVCGVCKQLLEGAKRKLALFGWRWWLWELPGFEFLAKKASRPAPTIVIWLVGIYIGLYGIMEARHERLVNRALFERGTFLTMVTSGKRNMFAVAMKDFGPIQQIKIPTNPHLFAPWSWFGSSKPNESPLLLWAQHYLSSCDVIECGYVIEDIGTVEQKYRIDFRSANLQGVDLRSTNLEGADLRSANLNFANLHKVSLTATNLSQASLRGADRAPFRRYV